jgi:hypothetical protein
MTERFDCGPAAAIHISSKFKIDGNLIYLYERDEWRKLLGKAQGECLYEIMRKIRRFAQIPSTKTWGEYTGVINLEITWQP